MGTVSLSSFCNPDTSNQEKSSRKHCGAALVKDQGATSKIFAARTYKGDSLGWKTPLDAQSELRLVLRRTAIASLSFALHDPSES